MLSVVIETLDAVVAVFELPVQDELVNELPVQDELVNEFPVQDELVNELPVHELEVNALPLHDVDDPDILPDIVLLNITGDVKMVGPFIILNVV